MNVSQRLQAIEQRLQPGPCQRHEYRFVSSANTAAKMKFIMADPLRFARATAIAEAAAQAHRKKEPINYDAVYAELVQLTRNHLLTLSPAQVAQHRRELEAEAQKTGNKFDMIAAEIASISLEAFAEGT